ncbi:MAG TPA: hypothetical protein VGH43_03435 [Jatrophihabitans sp.]|jgi:hypothetical protein
MLSKNKVVWSVAAVVMTVGVMIANTANQSQATTSAVDLSMSGYVVSGLHSASWPSHVAFAFAMTNHSSTTSADIAFTFSAVHGTGINDGANYICPGASPDTPSCEPGFLAPGHIARAGIIITPPRNTPYHRMTVTACASDLSDTTDPVPNNNCKQLTIAIS